MSFFVVHGGGRGRGGGGGGGGRGRDYLVDKKLLVFVKVCTIWVEADGRELSLF